MKMRTSGQWLLGSTPMEDFQQCYQIKHSSKANQLRHDSLLHILIFLGFPLQLLLSL